MLPAQQGTVEKTLDFRQLDQAILTLESFRGTWEDEIVDTAVSPLKQKREILRKRQKAPQQQRKFVTVLYVDITNSTVLIQQLEPEEAQIFLSKAIRQFRRAIEKHDGWVINVLGDGLMAVFGVPDVKEDDATRAIRAGLEMVAGVDVYRQEVKDRWNLDGYNIRIGVDTGPIIYDASVNEEQSAIGMVTHLAARMEEAAPAGGLRITHDTYQQIHGVFEVDAQPPLPEKSKQEPMTTYLVKSANPPSFRMNRRGIADMPALMVGRREEFDRLCALYEETRVQIKTNFVTIVGDPGIGKSRLLIDFENWLMDQKDGAARFRGRGFRPQQSTPYWVIRMFIANYCQIHDRDSTENVRLKLETALSRKLESDNIRKVHIIGTLLGYTFSDSPYLAGILDDAQQLREEGIHYLTEFFLTILSEGVTMLLVEDIHWADDPSLRFLRELERSAVDRPLLIICLARPELLERYPEWFALEEKAPGMYTRLNLKALLREDSDRLVTEILSDVDAIPDYLVETITSRADGNPLFIEEMIKVLIDDLVLIKPKDGKSWSVDNIKLGSFRVPKTLTGVLQSRLDRLPMAEKVRLQQASIVGRTFWEGVLEEDDSQIEAIYPILVSLEDRGHIYLKGVSTFAGEREYSFKHVLLRDVTYETVLIWDRKRHHVRTADWLSKITRKTGRHDEFAAVIAEHYELGEETDSAADWYLRAGEKAKDQGAPREAARFFDRALSLIPLEDKTKRLTALNAQEEVLGRLAEFDSQLAVLQSIVGIATELEDVYQLASAYSRRGFCYRNLGRYDEEIDAFETAVKAAQESGNRPIEAHSASLLAHSLLRHGDVQNAARFAEDSLQMIAALDDEKYRAKSLTNIAGYYSESGDVAKAVQLFSEIAAICSRLEFSYGESINLTNLGYNYILLGLSELAITPIEQAMQIGESIGARQIVVYCQLHLGLANYRMGQVGRAESILLAAIDKLESYDDRFGQASGNLYLGLALESSGQCDAAQERFREAGGLFEELGIPGYVIDAKAGIARCLLKNGDIEKASLLTDTVWKYLSESGSQGLEFPSLAYQTCCQIYKTHGRDSQARIAAVVGADDLKRRAERIADPVWRRSYVNWTNDHQIVI